MGHWNVNSLLAHNKLSMLEVYSVAHKYDVICISESYLDSIVPLDDNSLSLNGYNLTRADHLIILIEEGFVCTTRKTYPLGLSALHTLINAYYVK